MALKLRFMMRVRIDRWGPRRKTVEIREVIGDPKSVLLPNDLKVQVGTKYGVRRFAEIFKGTGLQIGDEYWIGVKSGTGDFEVLEKVGMKKSS